MVFSIFLQGNVELRYIDSRLVGRLEIGGRILGELGFVVLNGN